MGIEDKLKVLDSLEKEIDTKCDDILNSLKEKSSLNLTKIKFLVNFLAFFVGFLLAILLLINGRLHINLFLFLSVILPFAFTIFSFWKIFKTLKYKPLKLNFFEIKIIEKFIKTKNRFLGHILLLYLQIAAIFYVFGFIVGMFFVFLFKNVTFYYESTFNITPQMEEKILNFFALFKLDLNKISGNDMVVYIFSVLIVFVVIPRVLSYFFYKVKLNRLLEYFILNHPHYKKILNRCNSTKIKSSESNEEFKNITTKRKKLKTPIAKEFKNEAHFLFYQQQTPKNSCINLNMKTYKWAFNYFNQPYSEIEDIISKLNNYVFVVINANKNIIPNEEFREYIEEIAKNENVKKIFLLLCKDDKLVNRFGFVNYDIWKKFSYDIDKVEIYEEGVKL